MNILFKGFFMVVLCSIIACSQKESLQIDEELVNQTIVIGDYTFEIPLTFELVSGLGFDSSVGKIKGEGIEMNYDYGIYTSPYTGLPSDKFDVIQDTFDSIERQIVISKNPKIDFTSLHLRDLDNVNQFGDVVSLLISTQNITIEQQVRVVQIFHSVKYTPK